MFKYLKYKEKTWFGLYFLPIVYFSETLKHPLAAPCRFQTSVKKKIKSTIGVIYKSSCLILRISCHSSFPSCRASQMIKQSERALYRVLAIVDV